MNPGLFLRQALQSPATSGAILPSSPMLARAMARHAHEADLLVELGAGTGAVTQDLRESYPDVPLIAVEAQVEMAAHLSETFPGLDLRIQWAHELLDAMCESAPSRTVLVSSLPFRSLPPEVREITVASVCRFLSTDRERRLVQYTYQPRPPFDLPSSADAVGLQWAKVSMVWRNAPPAGVWVLR